MPVLIGYSSGYLYFNENMFNSFQGLRIGKSCEYK